MQDLLRIPKVQRMLYVRLFLSMNTYPTITGDNFSGVGSYELFSPMNMHHHSYSDLSPHN